MRGYIHGTDLYTATHEAFARHFGVDSFSDIRMRIPRFYHRALMLELDDQLESPNWQCIVDGRERCARWVETDAAEPLPREPLDEPALRRHIRIEGDSAQLAAAAGCTPIDGAVFLAKFLHEKLLPAGPREKWVLSRLELARSLAGTDREGMRTKLEARLGDSFTRTALFRERERLGSLFFSQARPGELK